MPVASIRASAASALAAVCLAVSFGTAFPRAGDIPQNEEIFVRIHGGLGESRAPSTRSRGMGGAWVALVNGAGSVQENPAALGAFTGKSVGGAFARESVEDGNDTASMTVLNLGGAFSMNPYLPCDAANQSVGIAYKKTDFSGAGAARSHSGDVGENGFTASWGRTFGSRLLGGASVSIVNGSWKSGGWPPAGGEEAVDDGINKLNNDLDYTGGEILLGGLLRVALLLVLLLGVLLGVALPPLLFPGVLLGGVLLALLLARLVAVPGLGHGQGAAAGVHATVRVMPVPAVLAEVTAVLFLGDGSLVVVGVAPTLVPVVPLAGVGSTAVGSPKLTHRHGMRGGSGKRDGRGNRRGGEHGPGHSHQR